MSFNLGMYFVIGLFYERTAIFSVDNFFPEPIHVNIINNDM